MSRRLDPSLHIPAVFLAALEAVGLPEPEAEYRFAPPRRWKFDYAFPRWRVALEVEGGVFKVGGGRHNRGAGFRKDLEKYNTAASKGWLVLRVLPEQLCAESTIRWVQDAIMNSNGEAA